MLNKSIIIKFVQWTKLKVKMQTSDSRQIYFREREVWWASLGANIGYEQDGANERFERPVLVLKKFSKDMLWILPLTRAQKTDQEKNAFKTYYYALDQAGENSFVILSQIRTISSKRLTRKMRVIYPNEFEEIQQRIKNFLV